MQMVFLRTPWKHEKSRGFLILSGGIERNQCYRMGQKLSVKRLNKCRSKVGTQRFEKTRRKDSQDRGLFFKNVVLQIQGSNSCPQPTKKKSDSLIKYLSFQRLRTNICPSRNILQAFLRQLSTTTNFWSMLCTPWKYQKTFGPLAYCFQEVKKGNIDLK